MNILITYLTKILTFISLSICGYTDYKTGKIKNYITIPGILVGLLLNYFLYGFDAFQDSVLGVFCLGLFGFIFALLSWIGYGDMKLLMLLGSLMGIWYSFGVLFVCSLVLCLYTIIQVILQKNTQIHTPFGIFLLIGLVLYEAGWVFVGV